MATTLTVEESTLERFKQLKAELDDYQSGVPDHTANSFLQSLMDTWEAVDDGYYGSIEGDAEFEPSIDGEVIEGQLSEVERSIQNRIDDLETELQTLREAMQR